MLHVSVDEPSSTFELRSGQPYMASHTWRDRYSEAQQRRRLAMFFIIVFIYFHFIIFSYLSAEFTRIVSNE